MTLKEKNLKLRKALEFYKDVISIELPVTHLKSIDSPLSIYVCGDFPAKRVLEETL